MTETAEGANIKISASCEKGFIDITEIIEIIFGTGVLCCKIDQLISKIVLSCVSFKAFSIVLAIRSAIKVKVHSKSLLIIPK